MARRDEYEGERRFHDVGARPVDRGGAHTSVGKLTRVALETDAEAMDGWSRDGGSPRAPGRSTRFAAGTGLHGTQGPGPSSGERSSGAEPAAGESAGSEERGET